MNDHKIFNEMAGIFSWVKSQQKPNTQEMTNKQRSFQIIKDFMAFLHIDTTNVYFQQKDEISALNDLANPKEQTDLKFERTFLKQNFIMYLLRIKIDKPEKNNNLKMLSLNFQMVSYLNVDPNKQFVTMTTLKKISENYNDKFSALKEEMLDQFQKEKYCRDGNFYFEEYLEENFS